MPKFTSFLNMTLPELNEFTDSWHTPLNQNFEDLDDWLKNLYDNLVATGTGGTWSALRGNKNSLAERIGVSIDSDGNLNVSSSSEFSDMGTSVTRGVFSTPAARLDDGDYEVYEARQPMAGSRFSPMPAGGPSAGFPLERLDAGVALRTNDFRDVADPIASPSRPWAPGLVSGGATPLISIPDTSEGHIGIEGGGTTAVFNIDGYIFRIREQILFDYSALSVTAGNYVWIYLSRNETDYNNASFKYSEVGGVPAAKDIRKLKSGTGVTSSSTFTDSAGTWNTAPFKVKEGDILVVESGTSIGSYVIAGLVSGSEDTQLTIKGQFPAGETVTYHIFDRFMPNIGAVVASTNPSDQYSEPPAVDGRVYIGRVKHVSGGAPTEVVTFAKNGVYVSGWTSFDVTLSEYSNTFAHNLGVVPSQIDIWVRENATSPAYRPLLKRTFVTDFDETNTTVDPGDAKKHTLLVPSVFCYSDTVSTTVVGVSDVGVTLTPAMFTRSDGTDVKVGEIRIIARR